MYNVKGVRDYLLPCLTGKFIFGELEMDTDSAVEWSVLYSIINVK